MAEVSAPSTSTVRQWLGANVHPRLCKAQNPLHQFPRSKSVTSLQHKRQARNSWQLPGSVTIYY